MSLLNNTCLLVQVRFQIPEREYKPEVSTVMHKGMEKHQKKRRKMPRSGEEDDIKPSCAPKKGGTVNDMDELRRGASMHKLFLETHIPRIRGEVSFAVSLIAAGDGVRFLAVDERPLQIQAVMERATILNWFKHHLERSPQTGCVHVVVFTQTEHTPRGSPF